MEYRNLLKGKKIRMLAVLLCMGLGLTACSTSKSEAEQTEHTKSFFATVRCDIW